MRAISEASLAKLALKNGTEPICLVSVLWDGIPENGITYGDRYFDEAPEVVGSIVSISSVDDVINFSKNGTTQSITVTISDVGNSVKDIFNNTDIHRKKAYIWQWFTGISTNDKILLFVGFVSSPIIWNESKQTLTFTILSRVDDFEVGFSPEEGTFDFLPQNLIGKAWPLCFGQPQKVPAVLIDTIPHSSQRGSGSNSVTKDATGIHDPSLDAQSKDNTQNAIYARELAQLYLLGYLQASFTARKLGELGDLADIQTGRGTFSGLAKQYLALGNKLLKQSADIMAKQAKLDIVLAAQKKWERDHIGVTNGNNFPQGQQVAINLNGALHFGYFNGDTFYITDALHPAADKYNNFDVPAINVRVGDPVITRENFFFADAGSAVFVSTATQNADGSITFTRLPNDSDIPIRYIVASAIDVTVNTLYAYRTVFGYRQLYAIPPTILTDATDPLTGKVLFDTPNIGNDFTPTAIQVSVPTYQVLYLQFGTLPVTALLFSQPMSSLLDINGQNQGWEDEIFCDVTSEIGPNPVDIMLWLIVTYTNMSWDNDSWTAVRAKVDPYPMHFALQDRPTAIKLIQDLAYQARCMVYMKGDVFFIKYLPEEDEPVDTITEADIVHESLEVFTTETEDIITKYIADWQPDYLFSNKYKVILRYNIQPYGVFEKSYNYFAYNLLQLVEKGATFWMIRDSNVYKKIKFKTSLSKLNIENLDTVTLNFSHSYVSDGPINGIVESATINLDAYEIEFQIWLPIRLGEMTQYTFAYPANLTETDFFPTLKDVADGRAGSFPGVNSAVKMPDFQKIFGGDLGSGGQVHITRRPYTFGSDPTQLTDTGNVAPEIITRVDAASIASVGSKPAGTTKYQYDKQKVDAGNIEIPGTTVFPGKVTEGSGDTYTVDVFYTGIGDAATSTANVKQLQIDSAETINPGTWVLVNRVVKINQDGSFTVNYYMQVPVWMSQS